jgi:hypothetical protein
MTLAKFHCYDAHTPFGTSKKVHLSRGSIITAVKPSAAVLWRTARFLLSLLLILFWSQTRFIYRHLKESINNRNKKFVCFQKMLNCTFYVTMHAMFNVQIVKCHKNSYKHLTIVFSISLSFQLFFVSFSTDANFQISKYFSITKNGGFQFLMIGQVIGISMHFYPSVQCFFL